MSPGPGTSPTSSVLAAGFDVASSSSCVGRTSTRASSASRGPTRSTTRRRSAVDRRAAQVEEGEDAASRRARPRGTCRGGSTQAAEAGRPRARHAAGRARSTVGVVRDGLGARTPSRHRPAGHRCSHAAPHVLLASRSRRNGTEFDPSTRGSLVAAHDGEVHAPRAIASRRSHRSAARIEATKLRRNMRKRRASSRSNYLILFN